LLLDSAISGIMISTKLAERSGVLRVADAQIGGIGNEGAASAYLGYANTIQVGSLEFVGCLVRVVDKKRMMGEDGYIGADVFQNFLVEINFPGAKFKLFELPKAPDSSGQVLSLQSDENAPPTLHDRYIAPEMQSYERFYRFGHQILLPTFVNKTPNSRLFLVNTGDSDTSLSMDLARQVTKVYSDSHTALRGFNGKVQNVYRADTINLGLPYSRMRQQVHRVLALDLTDMSNSTGTEISGVLGFSMLGQLDIKLDYRDGLVSFTCIPTVANACIGDPHN
jgi:Aspartyl protease